MDKIKVRIVSNNLPQGARALAVPTQWARQLHPSLRPLALQDGYKAVLGEIGEELIVLEGEPAFEEAQVRLAGLKESSFEGLVFEDGLIVLGEVEGGLYHAQERNEGYLCHLGEAPSVLPGLWSVTGIPELVETIRQMHLPEVELSFTAEEFQGFVEELVDDPRNATRVAVAFLSAHMR